MNRRVIVLSGILLIAVSVFLPRPVGAGALGQLTGVKTDDDVITIESLLNEMIDRDSVARFPETDFRLKQHSSYSRESKTPDDPEGWFMNHDFNKSPQDKNFIRIEENQGQKRMGPDGSRRAPEPSSAPGCLGVVSRAQRQTHADSHLSRRGS